MHWFDRMSKQFAAVPTATTRRSLLRGTAVAAVVAPFAPGALTYANNRMKQLDNHDLCVNCLETSAQNTRTAIDQCKRSTPKLPQELRKPKGGGGGKGSKGGKGGKSKKGLKPTEAAKRAACMARSAERFLEESNSCLRFKCAGIGGEDPPNAHAPEGSTCPSGTTRCTGTLCCYGTDLCCACATVDGGAICCVAVIQCSCC